VRTREERAQIRFETGLQAAKNRRRCDSEEGLLSDIPNHWGSQYTERFLSGAEYPDCLTGKDRCSFTAITVDI